MPCALAFPQSEDTIAFRFISEEEFKFFHQGLETDNPILLLLAIDAAEHTIDGERWASLINKLERQAESRKKAHLFLHDMVQETFRTYFQEETEVSTFQALLSDGLYNCVAGTALFAKLLDHFDFPYQILESQSHVFIQLELDGKPYIIESTTPERGLIAGEKKVKKFLTLFTSEEEQASIEDVLIGALPSAAGDGLQAIGLRELAGLQYYNDALVRIKKFDVKGAQIQVKKAAFLHPSDRILNFSAKLREVEKLLASQ